MIKFFLFCLLLATSCIAKSTEIEFVVTAGTGGPTDVMTRMLAKSIESETNLKFVVVNKPGASHNIGYRYIANSTKPTIFIASDTIVTNKGRLAYPDDIVNSVEPIFHFGHFSNVLIVKNKSQFSSLDKLVEKSKTKLINAGHGGIGTYGHRAAEAVCNNIFKNCLDVPYKSGSFAMRDLLSDSIDMFIPVSYGLPMQLKNTDYRAVLLLSNTSHPSIDAPVLPNQYKNLEIMNWLMLFQKNLSDEDISKIVKVLEEQDNSYYTDLGLWYTKQKPNTRWNK